MICGLRGGAAKYPSTYSTYSRTTEETEFHRSCIHFEKMWEKLQCEYQRNPNRAKECYGVEALPLLHFQNPTSFPIASVHAQLGLREKLIDWLAKKILGPLHFRNLQLEWIELVAGPPQQYHGGSYSGSASLKLLYSANLIDLQKFHGMRPPVPVLQCASILAHKIFGRELKEGWQSSISNFKDEYHKMREALKEIAIEQIMTENLASMATIDKEIEHSLQHVMEITRPTPKIHFLLNHLEEYLIEINEFQEHQQLGLGYFSEQVLESCHHSFNKSIDLLVGKHRLIHSFIKYNSLHFGFFQCNL